MFFLRKKEVIQIHERLIREFGGIHGIRDKGALESALAAAENRLHYEDADMAECAATYAYHLSQAHAFIDGNKRIAATISEIFVILNGKYLNASNDDIFTVFSGIAAGKISRSEMEKIFSLWIEDNE